MTAPELAGLADEWDAEADVSHGGYTDGLRRCAERLRAALAAQERPAPGEPAGCECGHAQTGHAFSDDVCAVPECPCSGYRSTVVPATELARMAQENIRLAAENRMLRELLNEAGIADAQPAPGLREEVTRLTALLAVSEAERDSLRQALDERNAQHKALLDGFRSNGSGQTQRLSGTVLARKYRDAGYPVRDDLPPVAGQ